MKTKILPWLLGLCVAYSNTSIANELNEEQLAFELYASYGFDLAQYQKSTPPYQLGIALKFKSNEDYNKSDLIGYTKENSPYLIVSQANANQVVGLVIYESRSDTALGGYLIVKSSGVVINNFQGKTIDQAGRIVDAKNRIVGYVVAYDAQQKPKIAIESTGQVIGELWTKVLHNSDGKTVGYAKRSAVITLDATGSPKVTHRLWREAFCFKTKNYSVDCGNGLVDKYGLISGVGTVDSQNKVLVDINNDTLFGTVDQSNNILALNGQKIGEVYPSTYGYSAFITFDNKTYYYLNRADGLTYNEKNELTPLYPEEDIRLFIRNAVKTFGEKYPVGYSYQESFLLFPKEIEQPINDNQNIEDRNKPEEHYQLDKTMFDYAGKPIGFFNNNDNRIIYDTENVTRFFSPETSVVGGWFARSQTAEQYIKTQIAKNPACLKLNEICKFTDWSGLSVHYRNGYAIFSGENAEAVLNKVQAKFSDIFPGNPVYEYVDTVTPFVSAESGDIVPARFFYGPKGKTGLRVILNRDTIDNFRYKAEVYYSLDGNHWIKYGTLAQANADPAICNKQCF